MKVVLFCGGLGMRMRDGVTSGPKPMAMIGDRPLMWHVMRYYAHFGHTDFVLCLGYGASYVKDFFLNYDETRSNDFVLEGGDARQPKLFRTDISDWRITFVDTGLHSAIGERLRRVRRFVEDEQMFLANYADVFTDAPLPDMIARFEASNAVASLLAVPPQSSHHVVDVGEDGLITQVTPVRDLRQWENGGYFVLRPEIFDYLNEGEDLVEDALAAADRAAAGAGLPVQGLLVARRHGQGAGPAGGDVPPRALPVDGLGPGAVGRGQPGRPAAGTPPGGRAGAEVSRHDVLAAGAAAGRPLSVLAIGAHPDDIEIGAGGLLLGLAESELRARYVVLTGTGERQQEARDAARSFLPGADLTIELFDLPEGRLPAVWGQVKEILEGVARSCSPDVIIAPSADDAHQDHRTIGELVPTVFRDQLYLAYEIPKWDGDLSRPSMYVPLSAQTARRKVELLHKCYPSQRGRDWWDDEVFLGLARLRGMECRARYAEAFRCAKSVIVPAAAPRGQSAEGEQP